MITDFSLIIDEVTGNRMTSLKMFIPNFLKPEYFWAGLYFYLE